MLRFRFDTLKKIQAAGVLMRLEHGRMDRLRLLKLLYIADRESLLERGSPIIGGRVVAMDNGPLHSDVYSLIKGEHPDDLEWSRAFNNDGHVVVLEDDPGRMELSPYEIEKLTEVSQRFDAVDTWAVVQYTHTLPEYQDAYKPDTSTTIPMDSILRHLGFTPTEIESIRQDAETHKKLVTSFQ